MTYPLQLLPSQLLCRPPQRLTQTHFHFLLLILLIFLSSTFALDFLINSFATASNGTNITLTNDAVIDTSTIRLTTNNYNFSLGRMFHTTKISMIKASSNSSSLSSFSTSFVFSVLPAISSSPGFGLCFVLSNSTSPPGAIARSQYFGIFSSTAEQGVAPLLVIEFDTGQNPEVKDPDGNHIGIDLNSVISNQTASAQYFRSSTGSFVPINMRSGKNVHAWIDFDGVNFEINVTVAPVGIPKPTRPTLGYKNPLIANYVSSEMFVGFSASKTSRWIEAQRILAWSFSDTGNLLEINTVNLPVFLIQTSSSLSSWAITGIVIGSVAFLAIIGSGFHVFWKKKFREENKDEVEDWELEYWPHRFSYEELMLSTNGFSNDNLLGSGGFGRVYRASLPNNTEVAVKCVSHDSKQGLREFMAEIESMGRLQHKNLVQMRGWCRKDNKLMLVYDYMPNGSLNRWIFNKPQKLLGWKQRLLVLTDVAEGLNYLHHGWDQVVVHRDIKSSNILLDSEMRGRLGDFGLAKLYEHGHVPNRTRVVGTLGYLAPELVKVAVPTTASDVYGFGMVVLEVVCGRRPLEMGAEKEEEQVLIDWVRNLYAEGRLREAADRRIQEEYETEEVEMVLKLGLTCCHPNPSRRPTIKEVLGVLVGDEVATAPAKLLNEFAQNGSAVGGGSSEETPPKPQL